MSFKNIFTFLAKQRKTDNFSCFTYLRWTEKQPLHFQSKNTIVSSIVIHPQDGCIFAAMAYEHWLLDHLPNNSIISPV